MDKHTVSAHDTKVAAEARVVELNADVAGSFYMEIGSGTYRYLVKRAPWAGGNVAAVRYARKYGSVGGAIFNC